MPIAAGNVFTTVYANAIPAGNIGTILTGLGTAAAAPAGGGLNNARGRWYEWVLALYLWNGAAVWNAANPNDQVAIVKLPPQTVAFDFISLFTPDVNTVLQAGLVAWLNQNGGMTLRMASPDFVCVTGLDAATMASFSTPLVNGSLATITTLDSAYRQILGKVGAKNLRFAFGGKTSVRADRRYLLLHEGGNLKALMAHLQTRYWDVTIRSSYFAGCTEPLIASDQVILRSAAMHSLVDARTTPVRAVDRVFSFPDTATFASEVAQMLQDSV